jgi:NADH-quinone oxidoreductase subunit M
MIQMLSHGLVSAALFLIVGVVYDRLHTRDIDRYGGLVGVCRSTPSFMASCWPDRLPDQRLCRRFLICSARSSEQLECFRRDRAVSRRDVHALFVPWVIFAITRDDLRGMTDLNWREKLVFAPLLVLVLWMGIYPSSFLTPIRTSVDHLVAQVNAANKTPRRADLSPLPTAADAAVLPPPLAGEGRGGGR